MKHLTVIFLCFWSVNSFAQFPEDLKFDQSAEDYIIYASAKEDTLFGEILLLAQAEYGVGKIVFKERGGKEHAYKGTKACRVIYEYKLAGYRWRHLPHNGDEPNKKMSHLCIIADGAIKLYVHEYVTVENVKGKKELKAYIADGIGAYNVVLDGKMMKVYVKPKVIRDVVVPYMNKCAAFKNSYDTSERIHYNSLYLAIWEYNKLCD
jgi:hypothetical protein